MRIFFCLFLLIFFKNDCSSQSYEMSMRICTIEDTLQDIEHFQMELELSKSQIRIYDIKEGNKESRITYEILAQIVEYGRVKVFLFEGGTIAFYSPVENNPESGIILKVYENDLKNGLNGCIYH